MRTGSRRVAIGALVLLVLAVSVAVSAAEDDVTAKTIEQLVKGSPYTGQWRGTVRRGTNSFGFTIESGKLVGRTYEVKGANVPVGEFKRLVVSGRTVSYLSTAGNDTVLTMDDNGELDGTSTGQWGRVTVHAVPSKPRK